MKSRPGVALLIALALLTLAATMVIGASSASRAMARGELSRESAISADAAARTALAKFMSTWSAEHDSLAVGSVMIHTSRNRGIRLEVQLRRLTGRHYLLCASAVAGFDSVVLGARKITILLERPIQVDSSTVSLRPMPVARWALTDIY